MLPVAFSRFPPPFRDERQELVTAIETLRLRWGWLLALGLASAGLGIVALILVASATIASVYTIAIFMILVGGGDIALALGAQTWGRFFFWVIAGVAYIAAGSFALAQPLVAAAAFTLLLAAGMIATGTFLLFLGANLDPPLRGPVIFAGALTLLIGVLILAGWPENRFWVLGVLLGLDLLLWGMAWSRWRCGCGSLETSRQQSAKGFKMTKWVYTFGESQAEGESGLRDLLGGKGADLAEMARLGLPVPPGFTITTEVCAYFYEHGKRYPPGLEAEVEHALQFLSRCTGRVFGDDKTPLLVSARSGAKISMPGMMDTVLNLGLNDVTAEALAENSGDARFAYDSYRRFIQMYASVVLGIEHHSFEEILEYYKQNKGLTFDTELSAADWQKLVGEFKGKAEKTLGKPFPQDPREQLWGAIGAVFESWMSPRAVTYRRLHNIPETLGTAVNIQAMVFGNMGETSATGVAFTRNPSTGAKELYGEFLSNAQGEDVVAGIRTPQYITEAARIAAGAEEASMEAAMPEVFGQFVQAANLLEKHFRDMQDMEFTVERGKLWMLQTRRGKRTAKAALRIAVDMTAERMISKEEAINRIEPASLDQLLHPALDPEAPREVIAKGLPASPGAASGEIVFSAADAEQVRSAGRKVILVRIETSPEDISGMHAAE